MEELQYKQLFKTQFGNMICIEKIDGYEITVLQNESGLILVIHYEEFCRAIVRYDYVAGRYDYTILYTMMTSEKLAELMQKFTESWINE